MINPADHKILVIIPAYNEENTIADVVKEVRAARPDADVAVINDGSADSTAKLARDAGAIVINMPFNVGIGGAMQTGYKYAMRNNYDIAMQVDGDGQHDPRSIDDLVKPIANGEADMVVGSRHIEDRGYETPFTRRFGMHLFSMALSLMLGYKVTDTTSGFRSMNRKGIVFFARNYPRDYPEVEALVLCHYAGFKIQEVPVWMRLRKDGKSSITPFKAVYYMTKVTLATLIWLIRKKPSLRGDEYDVR